MEENKLTEKLKEAKSILGDKAALIIAKDLGIEKFDELGLKGCCPFHHEDSPSFIWNPKNNSYHCFGSCSNLNYGIIDHYTQFNKLTFISACKKLFKETGVEYYFSEYKKEKDFVYPTQESFELSEKTIKYWESRGISKNTLEYCDVGDDGKGNTVFHFYDEKDNLLLVKYRPSRKVSKKESKTWSQIGSDHKNILFNMNKVNPDKPLILTEGEGDTMALIESGIYNCVSVPLGAGNYKWIEQCYDWLEQFKEIIVWSDNDKSGMDMRKEVILRLGSWRVKFVDLPNEIEKDGEKISIKDINEVLFYFGKETVRKYIDDAEESPITGIDNLARVDDFDLEKADGLYTGIGRIDDIVYKLLMGSVVIMSGSRGCVDMDTEFFNGEKWKKISEYVSTDKVLQFNSDETTELVHPTKYHKYPSEHLWQFSTKYGIDQCLSEEHEMVYWTSKGNLHKKSLKDVMELYKKNKSGFRVGFPSVFKYSGQGIDYDENTIRLFIASIADGSYYYQLGEHTKTYTKCRFHIKKDRKKERLEELLNNSNYEWRKVESANVGYTDFYVTLPIRIKEFDSWWYNCSSEQLEIIADEVLHWDGSINDGERIGSYFTTIKKNADFIQFVFTSLGFTSSIKTMDRRGRERIVNGKTYIQKSIDYQVIVSNRDKLYFRCDIKDDNFFKKYKTIDGYKYCFTVPSGMLVLRRNNRIFITGNSGKSSLINQLISESLEQNKDVFVYSGELSSPVIKNWLELCMAGPKHVTMKDNFIHVINSDTKKKIRDWYDGRIWVYNETDNKSDKILDKAISTIKRNGTKLIVLDNLMTIDIDENETNSLGKQKDFLVKLVNIAKTYGVLIILVVHFRKLAAGFQATADDVGGTAAITNLAHYVFSVKRFSPKEKEGEMDSKGNYKKGKEPVEEDVLATVLKNRYTGKVGDAKLFFDYKSYRFYGNDEELYKQYSWDDSEDDGVREKNERLPEFMQDGV